MTKSPTVVALTLSAALAGCASVPEPLKQVGTAASNLGTAALDAGKAGINAVRQQAAKPADAASAPADTKPVVKKPADVKWDKTFSEKFSDQNVVTRNTGIVAWFSPDKEFLSVTVKDGKAGSKVQPVVAYAQVSAEACNRTLSDTSNTIFSGMGSVVSDNLGRVANTSGPAAQILRQSGAAAPKPSAPTGTVTPSALTSAYAGLTDLQKAECISAIETVKTAVLAAGAKLSKDFSVANKGAVPVVTYSGTKGADIVLGLNTNTPATPARAPAQR